MAGSSGKTEHVFVIKNPDINTTQSNAAPFFNKEGLGIQNEHEKDIRTLIRDGDIEYVGVKDE